MEKKWSWFRKGYLKVRITGYSTERFLNLCGANRLEVWDLSPSDEGAVCFMTVPVFRKIKPLVRKTGVKIRILGRYGVPFFIYRNRKREGMLAGMASFFLLLYVLSLFVWNITFEGNYHYSRDTLLDYLESLDVRYGMRKNRISCEDLEESIRSAFPEITWVSASVSGTRLIVRIKENEVLSALPEKDESPCQLVAEKAGIITDMIVRQGVAQASIGDKVEEGQVLIASELALKDDSGQVIRTRYVHGDGDIYARTEYSYREEIPVLLQEKSYTGRKRYGFSVSAGPFHVRVLLPDPGKRQWNYVSENRQLSLFGDFYLPVYVEWIVGEEYVSYEKFCSENELDAVSRQIHKQYLENLIEKGVHIIENNVKIQRDGQSCVVMGTVTAEEQIGVPQKVEVLPAG